MAFSGETSGVRTAFSTLFTGKENILAKEGETVIQNENLTITTDVFTLFFNRLNKPKEPLPFNEMDIQIDI